MVCGNATIWKSSPTTPLTSIAITKLLATVFQRNEISTAIASLVTGDADVGDTLVTDKR